MTTMAYVMEAAARHKIPVFVLDRPNPVNGWQIEGPSLDPDARAFTSYFPMPIRHGLTLGELAQLFNGENKIGADLTVVAMQNWGRDEWFDDTGLAWTNPSPNMRNMNQATLYPGIGAIEGTNISVGRGTDTPFEQLGAPWIDGRRLADTLNARSIPGARFYAVRFTPTSSKYANQECQGVFIIVTDREALHPVRLGIEVAAALNSLYGSQYQLETAAHLLGSRDSLERLKKGEDPAAIASAWGAAEAQWRLRRAKYLLYRVTARRLSRALLVRVHPFVGNLDERQDIPSIRRNLDRADAESHTSRKALQLVRHLKRVLQLPAAALGFVMAARDQHQEFVSTPSKHVVGLTDVLRRKVATSRSTRSPTS